MQQAHSIFDLSVPVAPAAVIPYRGVDFTGANISVAGAKGLGIAKRPAAAGQSFEAVVLGTAICEIGAAVLAGQPLSFDNLGRVVPALPLGVAAGAVAMTSAAANGAADLTGATLPQWVVGDALETNATVGSLIEVLLAR